MPVKFVLPALPALGFFEKRQHVIPRPAAIAELAPMVEILGLATDIDHAVDRTRSAKHPAARIRDGASGGAGIGLGGIAPGNRRMVEQFHVAGRDVDQRVQIPSAGFEQYDAAAWIGTQPVGQYAPGRAGPDDHIVRLHCVSSTPLPDACGAVTAVGLPASPQEQLASPNAPVPPVLSGSRSGCGNSFQKKFLRGLRVEASIVQGDYGGRMIANATAKRASLGREASGVVIIPRGSRRGLAQSSTSSRVIHGILG